MPAVLLGSGRTVLGSVRCLARSGVPVLLANEQPGFVRASRWFRAPDLPPLGLHDDLAPYLEALPLERAVLFPCSDEWVERVARLPAELRRRFPASVSCADVVETLVDKGRFAEHLRARELPHPRTRRWIDGDLPAEGTEGPRLFLKPCRSQSFFRRFRVKALEIAPDAGNRTAAEEAVEEGFDLLVQEYVPGPASNHYFVDGFADAGGRVRGLMVRRRIRMYPLDFGSSSFTVSVAASEGRPAVDTVRDLLDGLGYRGIFSAELKRDERDGVFRLLEVNARPWIFVEFAARCGVDVCTMAYRDALGRDVSEVRRYDVGRSLVRPYYDFHAGLAERSEGGTPLTDVLRSWIGADVATFALDDPIPGPYEAASVVGRFVGRRIGRRLGGRREPEPDPATPPQHSNHLGKDALETPP